MRMFLPAIVMLATVLQAAPAPRPDAFARATQQLDRTDLTALRLAIEDLSATFGARYRGGSEFRAALPALEARARDLRGALERREPGAPGDVGKFSTAVARLRSDALLANPLLDFDRLMFIRRRSEAPINYNTLKQPLHEIGLPCNHWCNSSLPRDGYDNEIDLLSPVRPDGKVTTLHRPPGSGYVGEVDLNFDGERLLFTQTDATNWKIFELKTDGTALRQVSRMPDDVDAFDPCYLPDGRIIFGSTASIQAVPCWSGLPHRVANLYQMDADGGHVRQLCFDQDHDLYPTVRNDGQIMFTRWDYTGIRHEYLRILMTMNPDGTNQRALYGSNSWWPNALYFTRPVPGDPNKLIGVVSDYHGVPRMGWLALFDTSKGWREADGVVQLIPGRGKKVEPVIKEKLVIGTWPLFLQPFPLSEKYFLVSCRPSADRNWGLYLVDVFDNLVPIREEAGWALLEPIPLRATPRPPIIPDRVNLAQRDATIYIHDIYHGEGLRGVPRGTVHRLRLFSYHFGYPGLAGSSRIGIGGPWEVNRILGTVPVEPDGSAMFRVPANTPISLQPLDAEGKAVQVMRSWYTAMPGETISCLGCHERNGDAPATAGRYASIAARRSPSEIAPWHGPARGFDFEREVQPVLDRHCIECHNGAPRDDGVKLADLRARKFQPDYAGWPIGKVEPMTLRPDEDVRRIEQVIDRTGAHKDLPAGRLFFTPAYEALFPLVRRVDIEDAVDLPLPGEFHADTSRLVQILKAGHYGVNLDAESWDRLITWIDLNAPCHGTWSEVYAIPQAANVRRMELRALFGGPTDDPENDARTLKPAVLENTNDIPRTQRWTATSGRRLETSAARRRPEVAVHLEPRRELSLPDGSAIKLVRIPASADGTVRSFWMSACEITNRQYQAFDPAHDSGYSRDFRFRLPVTGRQGRALNEPEQPVVRVSWTRAMEFCAWLSRETSRRVMLPTAEQWEHACRADAPAAFSSGERDTDFSTFANLADKSLYGLGDSRFDDGAIVTTAVGRYRPNAWGLHDMIGNAAEWTLTAEDRRRVVRGGSFYDSAVIATSATRLAFPEWQRLHNVGFRIVCEDSPAPARHAQ